MPEYSKQLTSWVRYDLDTCIYIYSTHIHAQDCAGPWSCACRAQTYDSDTSMAIAVASQEKTWGTWFSQTTKHGGSCLLLTHVVMRNTDLYKNYIARYIYIYNRKITRRKFVMSQQVLVAAVWNRGTYQKIPAIWAINRWWGKSTE